VAGEVDIDAPVEHNVRAVAKALGGKPADITVNVLNRHRHEKLIAAVRATGARIKLFADGDLAAGIAAASDDSDIDLMLTVSGTPEGVITACAMKAMKGVIQARLEPRDEAERRKALGAGHDLDRVLHTNDLVTGDNALFVATGNTDGELLRGVRYSRTGAQTESIVMRSRSGTIRSIRANHSLEKIAHAPQHRDPQTPGQLRAATP